MPDLVVGPISVKCPDRMLTQIDAPGFFTSEALAAALIDWRVLCQVYSDALPVAMMLDRADVVRSDDLDFICGSWARSVASAGVTKIGIVVSETIWTLMQSSAAALRERGAKHGVEIMLTNPSSAELALFMLRPMSKPAAPPRDPRFEQDDAGQTPLHRLAAAGNEPGVRELIFSLSARGPRPERLYLIEAEDAQGRMAHDLAAANGHTAIRSLLDGEWSWMFYNE